MVKTKLVEELIKDGVKVLRELDRQKFPVESMFWVQIPEEDYWRLVIGSPIARDEGSLAGYRKLGQLLQKVQLAGVTSSDISLLDPKSQQFQSFLSKARGSSRLAAGPTWDKYEDAIIYRWTGASLTGELSCDVSSEELSRIWEDYQRPPLNEPSLLLSIDGRTITVRFHPQHGPQKRIGGIQKAFQIALHRARRDCDVTWLDQSAA